MHRLTAPFPPSVFLAVGYSRVHHCSAQISQTECFPLNLNSRIERKECGGNLEDSQAILPRPGLRVTSLPNVDITGWIASPLPKMHWGPNPWELCFSHLFFCAWHTSWHIIICELDTSLAAVPTQASSDVISWVGQLFLYHHPLWELGNISHKSSLKAKWSNDYTGPFLSVLVSGCPLFIGYIHDVTDTSTSWASWLCLTLELPGYAPCSFLPTRGTMAQITSTV